MFSDWSNALNNTPHFEKQRKCWVAQWKVWSRSNFTEQDSTSVNKAQQGGQTLWTFCTQQMFIVVQWNVQYVWCLSQFLLGTSPPATPGKIFWASESLPPGQFFCLIPLAQGQKWWSNSRRWGKISPKSKKLLLKLLSLQKSFKN